MSLIVIHDSETFHLVRAAKELPRFLALGVESELVTPLPAMRLWFAIRSTAVREFVSSSHDCRTCG